MYGATSLRSTQSDPPVQGRKWLETRWELKYEAKEGAEPPAPRFLLSWWIDVS